MIGIPSPEFFRDEGSHLFPFRHPRYLVRSNSFGEILHFVQDDSALTAAFD